MSKCLRPEVQKGIPASGGVKDLIDGMIYTFYNITDDELDTICENATDEEIRDFMDAIGTMEQAPSISAVRKGIEIRNKYVKYFQ